MVSKKRKAIIGAATAAATIAGLVYGAKKLHEKGYDKMAIRRLKQYSEKLKKEAIALEKRASKTLQAKKRKKTPTKKKKKTPTKKRKTRKKTTRKKKR